MSDLSEEGDQQHTPKNDKEIKIEDGKCCPKAFEKEAPGESLQKQLSLTD